MTTESIKKLNHPAAWVLLGAVLGGGGVYSAGLNAGPTRVHVGELRPAAAAAALRASSAFASVHPEAGRAASADAAQASPVEAGLAASAAAAPRAASSAPRPAGDRLLMARALDDSRPGEASAAFQANAAGAAKPAAAPAARRAAIPSAGSAAHVIAASGSVRYGLAGRSELMGRGAGPVYNLRGAAPSSGSTDPDSMIKQMGTMVQNVEQSVDQSPMDDASRTQLKRELQNAEIGVSDPQ